MPYFDTRMTDTDLLRAASVMESHTVRTLAGRLTDQGVTAERVRDRPCFARLRHEARDLIESIRDMRERFARDFADMGV